MADILTQEEINALLEVVDEGETKNPNELLDEINPMNFSNFLIANIEEVIEGLTGESFEFQLLGDIVFKSESKIIFDDFEIHFNGDFMIYVTEKTLAGEFSKRELEDDDYDMIKEVASCLVGNMKDIFTKKFETSLEYKFSDKPNVIKDDRNLYVYSCKVDKANLMVGILIKDIKEKPKENIEGILDVIEILENGELEGNLKNSIIKYNLKDIEKIIDFLKKL